MQIHELLQFVDDAVYLNTGDHLNDIQRAVIEGSLNHQKYSQIAENCGCSAGHAKDVGYELLQLLSDIFDEPVDKRNLKSALERQGNINISFGDNIGDNNSNIFGKGSIKISCKNPQNKSDKNNSIHPKFKHRKKNKTQIEKIDKLRYFGLSDEQIAEVLDLPLEVVKQVE